MPSRLNIAPVFLAHWRGLTMRTVGPTGLLTYRADRLARAASVIIPAGSIAAVLVSTRGARPDWQLDAALAGIAIGGAALMSATLIAAFTQLAAWRTRLTERDRPMEAAFRALIDEAVAHVLLASFEAALILAAAGCGLLLDGWPARVGAAFTLALAAHVIFLFWILVPRLYSAYVQTAAVSPEMDGFTRV